MNAHVTGLFRAVILCVTVSSTANAQTVLSYPRGDSIDVSVIPAFSRMADRFSYSYTAVSARSSAQRIWKLAVETAPALDGVVIDADAPPSWGFFFPYPGGAAGVRMAVWFGVEPNEWIAPKSSKAGFMVESALLPGIVSFWAQGYFDLPVVRTPEDVPDTVTGALLVENSSTGRTIGPGRPPNDDPAVELGFLRDQLQEGCELEWITTQCSRWTTFIQQVQDAFAEERFGDARFLLGEFVGEAEAEETRATGIGRAAAKLLAFTAGRAAQFIPDLVPDIGCVSLIAAQHIHAGEVCASNDADSVRVTYTAEPEWRIVETHLAVGKSLEDLPQTRAGNPIPGEFPVKSDHDAGISEITHTVALPSAGLRPGEQILIAAHAVMQSPKGGAAETAWGQGLTFPGSSWAMYFVRRLTVPDPPVGWVAVSAGADHTCGILTTSEAYCWGDNFIGALGNLEFEGRSSIPFPVPVDGGVRFASISAGQDRTCGVSTDGVAFCWGNNRNGETGTGSETSVRTPAPVLTQLTFVQLETGTNHSCGTTSSGDAFCWGVRSSGQLGDGTIGAAAGFATEPVPVAGGIKFTSISMGGEYSCGLSTSGDGYCWGRNIMGQIGDGSTVSRSTPFKVMSNLQWIAPGASNFGQTCALTLDSELFCWGRNERGELGETTELCRISPDFPCSTTPVRMAPEFGQLRRVSIGVGHRCGLTDDGSAFCWGDGRNGQLGNGTTESSPVPVSVNGGHRFESIDAGSSHTCGITVQGSLYCWGSGGSGRLGSETSGSSIPLLVDIGG